EYWMDALPITNKPSGASAYIFGSVINNLKITYTDNSGNVAELKDVQISYSVLIDGKEKKIDDPDDYKSQGFWNAGTYVITYTTNENYRFSTSNGPITVWSRTVKETFTVDPRPITVKIGSTLINFGGDEWQSVKDGTFDFTALLSLTSGTLLEGVDLTDVVKVSALDLGELAVGNYVIAGEVLDNNYAVTFDGGWTDESKYEGKYVGVAGVLQISTQGINLPTIQSSITYGDSLAVPVVGELKLGEGYTVTYKLKGSADEPINMTAAVENLDAGIYLVTVVLSANSGFTFSGLGVNADGSYTAEVTVNPRDITVTISNINDVVYGSDDWTAIKAYGDSDWFKLATVDTSNDKLNVLSKDSLADIIKIVCESEFNVGTIAITGESRANEEGNTVAKNYDVNFVAGSLVVTKASVTAPSMNGKTYDGTALALAAISGLTSADYTSESKLGSTAAEIVNAGTYTVSYTITNPNYKFTATTTEGYTFSEGDTKVEFTVTIGKASITVTSDSSKVLFYQEGVEQAVNVSYDLKGTGNSSSVAYTLKNESGATLGSSNKVTAVGKYTLEYVITADNHENESGSIAIEVKSAVIFVQISVPSVVYGTATPTYSASEVEITGLTYNDTELWTKAATADAEITSLISSIKAIISSVTVDEATPGLLSVGTYNVKLNLSAATVSYDGKSVEIELASKKIFSVTARPITVDIGDKTTVYGSDEWTTLKDTVEWISAMATVNASTPLVTGDAIPFTVALESGCNFNSGTYALTATAGDDNYDITFNYTGATSSKLVIDKASVATPSISGKTYDGTALTIASLAGLTLDTHYTVSIIELTDGSVTSIVNAGTYNVTYTLKDDGATNYKFAANDNSVYTVTNVRIAEAQMVIGSLDMSGVYNGQTVDYASNAQSKLTLQGSGNTATWTFEMNGSANPVLKNAGNYTVSYSVSAPNHTTATGTFDVAISAITLDIAFNNQTIAYGAQTADTIGAYIAGLANVYTVMGTPVVGERLTDIVSVSVSGLGTKLVADDYVITGSKLTNDVSANYVVNITD
ncbi:MAG: hypothetical protein NC132_07110, partial [Corallococcus sp.]|nr:hypothetical protein [Corallococcus sp.]